METDVPNDPRIFNRKQADGTYRPLSDFFDGVKQQPPSDFREIDFDPNTMTRATQQDISRIWGQLWGEWPLVQYSHRSGEQVFEDGEYLDYTQEV